MLKGKRLAVLGAGKLGETLVRGLLEAGVVTADRVIVTAAAREAPPALLDQLKMGGRMIIPIGESRDAQQLVEIDKTEAGLTETPLLPVRFVPLVQGRAGVGARAPKGARAVKPEDA